VKRPVPWLQQGSEAPSVAQLLDGARKPPPFTPAARARVGARLAEALPTDAPSGPTAQPSGLAGLGRGPIIGGTIVLALVGAFVTAQVWDRDGGGTSTSSSAVAPRPPVSAVTPAVPTVLPEPTETVAVGDLPNAPAATVPSASSKRQNEPSDSLVEELRLVDGARAAMGTDPARALATLAEHQRRFPRGQLSLERDVLRVSALVKLGRRAEAEALVDDIARRAPGTPSEEHARALLGERPSP
jgi:hypothetical protein